MALRTACLALGAGCVSAIEPPDPSEGTPATNDAGRGERDHATRAPTARAPAPRVDAGSPVRSLDAGAPSARRCATPAGIERAPRTIAEAVGLLNALPKPTSLACFVESLPRPLDVYLTSSKFSAQPAVSEESPRIFIIEEPLFLAFVPEGVAEGLLEIGWRTSPDRAIRTEIVFPTRAAVTAELVNDHIALTDRNSFCGNCHFGEAPAYDAFLGDRALESDVNPPNPDYEVELDGLRERAQACDPEASPRCELLDALFGHGEVRPSRAFARGAP